MILRQRKAELAEQHLRLTLDHVRISALARRHPDRASIYDRVLKYIEDDLAVVAARLALLDAHIQEHRRSTLPSPESAAKSG